MALGNVWLKPQITFFCHSVSFVRKYHILGFMNFLSKGLGFFLLAFLLASCFFDETSSGSPSGTDTVFEKDRVPGMVRVFSSGKSTILGTNEPTAKVDERPQMRVDFTYDYAISRHEVICSDFNEVMKDVSGLQLECAQDSMPASNVTFFDVALYANAMSKKMGLDSAYVFSSAEFDAGKHCMNLNDFSFRPDVAGFRLPTEAEWVFAAEQVWDPERGWNFLNSDYAIHKVCTSAENTQYFCDMAGNVLEWVNDGRALYNDSALTNFVGGVVNSNTAAGVVKGGSFRKAPNEMFLYKRGDDYPIVYSTRADYVGFRLAYGAIPNATFFSENGDASLTPIKVLVNDAEIMNLTESYKAKLAFRNDESGNLVYVSFSAKGANIVEIPDTMEVYHPEISPNGQRVAFCTSAEGKSGHSSIYVRDLDDFNHNLVKLDVPGGAAIPRWRVRPNGDTVIVYVTSPYNNDGDQFLQESTWEVPFADRKFGTPTKLFDGAYHGGVSDDNRLAVSGSSRLRAREETFNETSIVAVDDIWYNREQACNVSLSKDGTKRTLFLDFGGSVGRSFVGTDYKVHEELLIADSTGNLIQAVPTLAGFRFDHSEWAGGILKDSASNLVVVSLTNINEAHEYIALVDLKDNSVHPLVQGGDLWHPCLWVRQENASHPKPVVDKDSAGAYFKYDASNPLIFSSVELAMHMKSFWKYCDKVEAVAFGSSMTLDAVIETTTESFFLMNMGVSLSDVHLAEYLLKNYFLPYAPNLKVVIVELTPGLLFRYYEENTGWLINHSPGLMYDMNHLSKETKEEIADFSLDQEYPKDLFSQQYLPNTFLLPPAGWLAPNISVNVSEMHADMQNVQSSLDAIKSIKRMADSCGLALVAAITPRNPAYRETEAYDVFGPSWDVAHELIQAVADMGILIFDEYKDGLHDYTDVMAANEYHVSYLGAIQFTERLDSLLKTLPVNK